MAKIRINGDTSGYIEISAPAVAGSTSITLPATTGGSLLATDANGNLNVDSGTLYVDASNNRVGIGTTSVSQKLHLYDASNNTYVRAAVGANTGVDFGAASDGNGVINVRDNAALQILTNGSEKARIDSSGRFLVGTSSARANFFNSTATRPLQIETADNTAGISVVRNSNADGGPGIILASSAGTTVGSNTLVSSTQDLGAITFQGNDGSEFVVGAQIAAAVDGTPGANDMPGRLVFSTTADGASSPTERMRITSGGLFKFSSDGSYGGIDTNSHGIRMTASGEWAWAAINAHASNPYGIKVSYTGAAPNNTSNYFLYCGDTSALRVEIRANGGIANYQANNVNLSDINSKKDISPASGTWDCIKEWEIVNYRYKDQPDEADLNLGVIAQQVAESCPEVITVFQEATEDKPEKLGVKEQQMYWMAIKALQEAQLRIEQLEATNASFEARLSALEVKP